VVFKLSHWRPTLPSLMLQKSHAKFKTHDHISCLWCRWSREKGVSTWLTALPIEKHRCALHKATFRDSLFLRYVWPTPELTISLQLWTTIYCWACPDVQNWRLPSSETHWGERYITAMPLTEVCHGMQYWTLLTATLGLVLASLFSHPLKMVPN